MNVLYLNGYKCLLSQNRRVIIDFLGYIRYDTLAKHIKPFFERPESGRVSARINKSILARISFYHYFCLGCLRLNRLFCCLLMLNVCGQDAYMMLKFWQILSLIKS